MVRQIQASSERANRLVRDLLDLTQARIGGGIPVVRRQVEVSSLIADALDELIATHPERAVDYDGQDVGLAVWDPDRIGQALTNLLNNAVAYSPVDKPVRVSLEAGEDTIEIAIRNAGSPIPADRVGRLFEPFMRGTASGTGSSVGLGLYIVREIVHAHAGEIDVSSTSAAGTTFTIRLPRDHNG